MAQLMRKAMVYLGLVDTDEDEYDDGLQDTPTAGKVRQAQYGDQQTIGAPEFTRSSTVRPLSREEARETPSTIATRPTALRPLITPKPARVSLVVPARFGDAQEIGDLVKGGSPVIVNLQASERDLGRRMIDFCSGVTYALGGSMEKVGESIFLLTPSNVEISAEERQRLQEHGFSRP